MKKKSLNNKLKLSKIAVSKLTAVKGGVKGPIEDPIISDIICPTDDRPSKDCVSTECDFISEILCP